MWNPFDKLADELLKLHPWMLSLHAHSFGGRVSKRGHGRTNIFLSICDHFEPFGGGVEKATSLARVKQWVEHYPLIADQFRDSEGCLPKYTFFYPEEEYDHEHMGLLADLCHKGYGEVEVHLHHDNDTADNLRRKLTDFIGLLSNKYGLLSRERKTAEIKYGFIHGNWALDNSRPDGGRCGVNNEIDILQETGCYADFTMPSSPDVTQTTIINSIYYAVDNPREPKSHNKGSQARKNWNGQKGLLMVQGPLLLNWRKRKWKLFPKIENGFLGYDSHVDLRRIALWRNANIHVEGKPEYLFIKLYTHGCQEKNIDYLLHEQGLATLFSLLRDHCTDNDDAFHFVTAREMVNIIKAIENDYGHTDTASVRDYQLVFEK